MYHNVTDRYWGNVTLYGYDQTLNLWWWTDGGGTYYISAAPGIPITVDAGANCNPSGFLYNSQPYYSVSGGYLWYDSSISKWVISSALGYKTDEYQEESTWHGDAWWSSSSLAGSYTARGSGYGGAAKTVALGKVVGWKSSSKFGVYEPETGSGLTEDKYVGWIYLRDSSMNWNYWEQPTQYNDNPIYKYNYNTIYGNEIWFDGENWIMSSAKGVKDYTEPPVYTPWISGQLYAVGSSVSHDGKFYRCWLDLSNYPSTYLTDVGWGWNEITRDYSSYIGYWSCATKVGTYSLVWPYVPPTPGPPYNRPYPETHTISGPQYSGTNSSGTLDQSTQLIAQVAQWLA